jgi:hypothetical protein
MHLLWIFHHFWKVGKGENNISMSFNQAPCHIMMEFSLRGQKKTNNCLKSGKSLEQSLHQKEQ